MMQMNSESLGSGDSVSSEILGLHKEKTCPRDAVIHTTSFIGGLLDRVASPASGLPETTAQGHHPK